MAFHEDIAFWSQISYSHSTVTDDYNQTCKSKSNRSTLILNGEDISLPK